MPTELRLYPTDWLPLPLETVTHSLKSVKDSLGEKFEDLNEAMGGDWSTLNKDGKLSKRASNSYFKRFGESLPSTPDYYITQYAESLGVLPTEYRVVDKLDWPMQSHGTSWSCLWTQNRHIRATFVALGGHGLLLRNDNGNGVGRGFLIPYEGAVVVTNSRGPLNNEKLARLTAAHLGTEKVERSHSFYAKTTHGRTGPPYDFYTDGGEYMVGTPAKTLPKEVVLDGCFCSAKFSNVKHEHLPICLKCPFDREKKWTGGSMHMDPE